MRLLPCLLRSGPHDRCAAPSRRARLHWLLATLLVLLLAVPALAAEGKGSTSLGKPAADGNATRATIDRISWETFDGRARLVVAVRGAVHYTTHVAGADAASSMPHRAYVDLRPAVLGKDVPRTPQPIGDGLAQRLRVGQFDPQTVRIVVDLSAPALFEVRTSERPPRLLLALEPRDARDAVAARPAETAPPPVAPQDDEPRAAAAEPVLRLAEAPVVTASSKGVRTAHPAAVTSPTQLAPSQQSIALPVETAREVAAIVVAEATASPRAGTSPPGGAPAEQPRADKQQDAPPSQPAGEPSPQAALAAASEAGGRRASKQKTGAKAARPQPTPRVWTVVLDPGHGGRDPGARGVTGDEEKEITLVVARLIADKLGEDAQIRAVLTRNDDSYVSLEQRTAIANAQGADLFVSIHANASENPQLAGVETYTLNNTDDRATIRLAALENGLALTGAAPGERDLAYILSDLVQTGKEDESVTLARAVQRNLVSYLRDRWRGVANLGVKKGPFYVLVGAYMPCILVEVAFLTNETEGQRIAARRYQADVADGIAQGIRRFLASENANANL